MAGGPADAVDDHPSPRATPLTRARTAGDRALRWAGTRAGAWSPRTVALVAGVAALAFVAIRLLVAADGDIGRFVVAGQAFVDPGRGVHVFPSTGYDGQFYWRLAVDPAEWARHAHGVTFDNAYRAPRLGYPLLAYLAAGGQAGLVPWTLVGVNVAAVAAIGGMGGRLARDAGHPAAYGLLVAAAPGLVMPLGRDLAECVTVACLLGGLLAVRGGRVALATGLWSYALFTREQALLTIGAFALWRLLPPLRRALGAAPDRPHPTPATGPALVTAPPPGRADLAWVVPVLVWVGWQALLWHDTGGLPAASAGGNNLVPPFSALVPGLGDWVTGGLPRLHVAAPLQLATVVALCVAAARVVRAIPDDLGYVALALALAAAAATCLATSIWRDPSDMRHLVDVSLWSSVVLVVARPAPARWVPTLAAVTWAATAAVRLVAI